MDAEFINMTAENLDGEHLCCIIRRKKLHPGVEAKRQWLSDQSFAKKFGFGTVNLVDVGYVERLLKE